MSINTLFDLLFISTLIVWFDRGYLTINFDVRRQQTWQRGRLISNILRFLVYMSDYVNETPHYVADQMLASCVDVS